MTVIDPRKDSTLRAKPATEAAAAISDAYIQGWSDCMDAVCVPEDNTRPTDEQGLALYLKTKGVG